MGESPTLVLTEPDPKRSHRVGGAEEPDQGTGDLSPRLEMSSAPRICPRELQVFQLSLWVPVPHLISGCRWTMERFQHTRDSLSFELLSSETSHAVRWLRGDSSGSPSIAEEQGEMVRTALPRAPMHVQMSGWRRQGGLYRGECPDWGAST